MVLRVLPSTQASTAILVAIKPRDAVKRGGGSKDAERETLGLAPIQVFFFFWTLAKAQNHFANGCRGASLMYEATTTTCVVPLV
jgi:hypothetical protein